jgi:hypothetical protein
MIRCPACEHEFPPAGEVPHRCPQCSALVLGGYCDLRWIGGGGMGDVYRAREPRSGDRTVAVKIPRLGTDLQALKRRFEREVSASARLHHENAVRVYDRGEESGRPYLVMEFVRGVKLSDVIWREHPLAPRRAARIVLGVARGLVQAERLGIVNRDVKPANVFLARPDDTPKILDYGLALIVDQEEEMTRDGAVLGTPNYTAPEQLRDPHGVSIAADVYSLGCTAYCTLVGHPPFRGKDLDETVRLHAEGPRPWVRDARPDVPEELDRLLRSMLAADPHGRPSPQEVVRLLEGMLPRLSEDVPALATAAEASQIDVVCPGCKTCYHLSASTAGQRVKCPNRLCGAILVVPPLEDAAKPSEPPNPDDRTTDVLEAGAIDNIPAAAVVPDEPPMATAIDDDLPPVAEARLAEDDEEIEVLPAAAIVVPGKSKAFAETTPEVEGLASLPTAAASIPAETDDALDLTLPDATPAVASAQPVVEKSTATAAGASTRRAARRPSRRERGKQRARRARRFVLGGVGLLFVAAAVLLWWKPPDWTPASDKSWTELTDLVAEHKWTAAARKLDQFEEDFPSDERVNRIPFFRDLCTAGPEVYSTTGDPAQGLALLQQVFQRHRDNPAYAEYCPDLYQALVFLIDERLLKEAQRSEDPKPLELARQAVDLLRTVGQAMQDPWVAERTAETTQHVAETARIVERGSARARIARHLEELKQPDPNVAADEHFAAIEKELAAHAALRDDPELAAAFDAAYQAEPARVRYVADDARTAPSARPTGDQGSQGTTLAVVWGQPAGQPVLPAAESAKASQVLLALARGVLYAFDPQGKLLWARRLGVDSHRLPARIARTASSPPALIAFSSEEGALVAIEAGPEGRVLWRHPLESDAAAGLSIVPRRAGPNDPVQACGFLPTSRGEIDVLELVLGKRLGRYRTGQPMTVAGTFDPTTGLAFFPADAKRIYALDPAAIDDPSKPACRSVLFTRHAAGALRSAPSVVGQYLIVAESSELEHTSLRVFEVGPKGFAKANAAPLKQLQLRGWSWFAPHATPDRITLVTDRGDLGIFGLNLDNVGEAIYPIVHDLGSPATVTLGTRDDARTLAVAAAEHLVWVMAGGRLQKLSVDMIRQQVKPLWPSDGDAGVAGIPVHEAQIDPLETVLFLATMSPGGQGCQFTAVDADSGRRHWQCQLGMLPLGDPLVWNDRVVLLDAAGQKLSLKGPQPEAGTLQLVRGTPLPRDADERQMFRLGDPPGPIQLVVPLEGGAKLAVSTLADPDAAVGPWTVLPLPARLHGRPCVSGPWLVVPCADGQLYRLRCDGSAAGEKNEVTFTWSRSKPPGPVGAELYPLGPQAVLVVDERRRLRRIEPTTQDLVTRWIEVGAAFQLPSEMQGRPLVVGDEIFVFDTASTLFRLDARNPNRQVAPPLSLPLASLQDKEQWDRRLAGPGQPGSRSPLPVGAKVTAGPVLRGDHLVAVVDQRRVLGVPLAPSGGKPAFWLTEPFAGRIRGEPVLAQDVLLVADNSREVTGVRLADGSSAWRAALGVRSGPAATPVPCGPGKMLVPLADGTLLVLPLPTSAEAKP